MEPDVSQERQQAHKMLDHLAPEQLSAVRGLLEVMVDPLTRKLTRAPLDDEPVTEEERQTVARSEAWFEGHGGKGIPMEEVLADFGLTVNDFPLDRSREERGSED